MATIRDVAQDAGVSVGTVSNVINGGSVSKERRLRVQESIRKLGYQVNGLARDMRMQRSNYVAVILPNITNPYFSLILQELEHSLQKLGKQPILCISDGDSEKEIKYIEMAKSNKIDGIIGVTYSDVEGHVEDSMAFVSIDRHFSKQIPCVSCDNYAGGSMAAENLIRRGATNLLFFQTIMSIDSEVRKRRMGFEAYCEEAGVSYASVTLSEKQVSSVYSSFSSRNLIRATLKTHLENHPVGEKGIDAVFAGTDHLAIVVVEELRNMGLRVPEDIQVMGYDGIRMMNYGNYLVSSIYQNPELIAQTSVDCLMRMLDGEPVESIVTLPVHFVDGGTTQPQPIINIR